MLKAKCLNEIKLRCAVSVWLCLVVLVPFLSFLSMSLGSDSTRDRTVLFDFCLFGNETVIGESTIQDEFSQRTRIVFAIPAMAALLCASVADFSIIRLIKETRFPSQDEDTLFKKGWLPNVLDSGNLKI